jgi:hypothetical protein
MFFLVMCRMNALVVPGVLDIMMQVCNGVKRRLFRIHIIACTGEVELREKKKLGELRTGLSLQQVQFYYSDYAQPFDALAVDAWDTLAAEIRAVDWPLRKGCSASAPII